jgi:4-amino-4-deoxy-L-arabinose transferase-like glycosyltransferase
MGSRRFVCFRWQRLQLNASDYYDRRFVSSLVIDNLAKSKHWIVLSIVIGAILCGITNLPWQLDDYDQGQQAYTSFEMVKEGHWFYQRTPHEQIAKKPPLVGWASAGFYYVLRSWNIAWRLPSFLCTGVVAVLLFRMASKAYGRTAGFIAAGAFIFNLLTVRLATMVRTDVPLALFTFIPGLIIFERVRSHEPWSRADRFWFFVVLAVSMWIKGPFAFLFLLPAVALFQWRYHRFKGGKAWFGWWPWLAALAVFAIWVGMGIKLVPGFYQEVVTKEFLGRLDPEVHRSQPVYFYLLHYLYRLAPWSVLMIGLGITALNVKRQSLGKIVSKLEPETFWLIAWALTGFIIMSFVPSKRVDRVYPAIPPLCLLLAAQFARISFESGLRQRVARWAAITFLGAMIFTTGYSVLKIVSSKRNHFDSLVTFCSYIEKQARAHGWHYEIVGTRHSPGTDGMLLYLQRLHFLSPEDSIARWNAGEIDTLVVPSRLVPDLLESLNHASLDSFKVPKQKKHDAPSYSLITRTL